MKYGELRKYDTANGPGVRTTLFVSGCSHRCKGCHNEVALDFNYGNEFTPETLNNILEYVSLPQIEGFSLLGGEPFDNTEDCITLLEAIKSKCPHKSIWIWSGYTYEQICKDKRRKYMLSMCDILIDGRFVESKRNLNLYYRGSDNQRIIDVNESLKNNTATISLKYNR